jgi:hypothetical protein
MSRRMRMAAVMLAAALGLGGCYYGPAYPSYGGYGPGYGYDGYDYGYSPGYYYGPSVSGSFYFGDFGHRKGHRRGHRHHGW